MSEQNSKWWEFYGVRYAQGTVVGAMIVFFLFSQNEVLKKILFVPQEHKDFGVPHLVLLAVYGLAYCYIASAPILIMHAARGLLFKSLTNSDPTDGAITRALSVLVPAAVSVFIYFSFYQAAPTDNVGAAALFIFVFLVAFQFRLLYEIFHASWLKTINYYVKIVAKRRKDENREYVESYRHIREHGNSFLIVLFQFLLALPIFIFVSQPNISSEDSIRHLAIIIIIWVMPSAAIWAFGNKLETHIQNI